MFIPEKWEPIVGYAINPSARERPEEFVETGISAIDGLNTLVKGQKLPLFSCAGLPSKEVAAEILKNARTPGGSGGFVVVFVALGLTFHEYSFYMKVLSGMRTGFVAFVNLADEPSVERLLAPRYGLTVAEYLAFEKGGDVLVVITDMTNYCDALREVSTAREELPGRRGYPGYMYSDLASLYERAGRIKGLEGSVTMLPVVTMPEDDITHPIPDLTGYITEGQIVLTRELNQKGVFPPIDVFPSLSRLMQRGIGSGHTREDHRRVANLLYKYYAKGRDLRRLEAIVGRDGMTDSDWVMLDFADAFEKEFIHQGGVRRDIRGNALRGLGRNEEAISSYDRSIELSPKLAGAWMFRGIALGNLGRYEDAIECYDRAIAMLPTPIAEMWFYRGIALGSLGRHAEGLESFEKALELDPGFVKAWVYRGVALGQLGRVAEAVGSYDGSLALDAGNAKAWHNRANALSDLGRYEEALASYDQAVTRDPQNEFLWTDRGLSIVYDSWKKGVGHRIIIQYDSNERSYGIVPFLLEDGTTSWCLPLADEAKPVQINEHGTRVTLLGMTEDQDTMANPGGAKGGRENWLFQYLNTRYYKIPESVKLLVRIGYYRDAENKRHNYLREVNGQLATLESNKEKSGTVSI